MEFVNLQDALTDDDFYDMLYPKKESTMKLMRKLKIKFYLKTRINSSKSNLLTTSCRGNSCYIPHFLCGYFTESKINTLNLQQLCDYVSFAIILHLTLRRIVYVYTEKLFGH